MEKSSLSKFKDVIQKAREKTRLIFYSRSNFFNAQYRVEVVNNSEHEKEITLIIPVPGNESGQELQNEPCFIPDNVVRGTCVNGSNFAMWKGRLFSKQKKIFEMKFTVNKIPLTTFAGSPPVAAQRSGNKFIHPNDSRIKEIRDNLELESCSITEKIEKINAWVISSLRYDNSIVGLYTDIESLEKGSVDCGGFNTLFMSICRSAGIPCRLILGFWAGYKQNEMHAWVEVYNKDSKSWIVADPSVEQLRSQGRTRKAGRLGFIGSDRIIFSNGCDYSVQTNTFFTNVDILQHPILLCAGGNKDVQITTMVKGVRL